MAVGRPNRTFLSRSSDLMWEYLFEQVREQYLDFPSASFSQGCQAHLPGFLLGGPLSDPLVNVGEGGDDSEPVVSGNGEDETSSGRELAHSPTTVGSEGEVDHDGSVGEGDSWVVLHEDSDGEFRSRV